LRQTVKFTTIHSNEPLATITKFKTNKRTLKVAKPQCYKSNTANVVHDNNNEDITAATQKKNHLS